MELIAAHFKFKVASSVLKRYEPTVDNGTLCLYNAENGLFWYGNQASSEIVNLLDGNHTVKDITENFNNCVNAVVDGNQVEICINNILTELLNNKMIVKVE